MPATNKRFKCNICRKSLSSKSTLDRHKRMHTGEKPYNCPKCFLSFYRQDYVKRHVEKDECEAVFSCGICSQTFSDKTDLKQHERIHSTSKKTKLAYFQNSNDNYTLQKRHEGNGFRCEICEKTFLLKQIFQLHQRTHICKEPVLSEVSFNAPEIQEHLNPQSGPLKEKSFKCKLCRKDFVTKFNLERHEKIHLREKPYKCNECLKTFSNEGHLKVHARIHTINSGFRCEVCKILFPHRKSLENHECNNKLNKETENSKNVASTKKLFMCDMCEKTFNGKESLQRHKSIHVGEMVFE